jgi:hypothetical protein
VMSDVDSDLLVYTTTPTTNSSKLGINPRSRWTRRLPGRPLGVRGGCAAPKTAGMREGGRGDGLGEGEDPLDRRPTDDLSTSGRWSSGDDEAAGIGRNAQRESTPSTRVVRAGPAPARAARPKPIARAASGQARNAARLSIRCTSPDMLGRGPSCASVHDTPRGRRHRPADRPAEDQPVSPSADRDPAGRPSRSTTASTRVEQPGVERAYSLIGRTGRPAAPGRQPQHHPTARPTAPTGGLPAPVHGIASPAGVHHGSRPSILNVIGSEC